MLMFPGEIMEGATLFLLSGAVLGKHLVSCLLQQALELDTLLLDTLAGFGTALAVRHQRNAEQAHDSAGVSPDAHRHDTRALEDDPGVIRASAPLLSRGPFASRT